ncbi:hypothetical protein AMTR_s00045p00226350 [Amborella trichopoda]|uniref:Uncharacterized protein n=1 Tax=Amborella trichopoda TaxID=13333 RepID=W1P5L5_AMBTC|nr:hypothetical protein AMTR_s00045p00226350 [Amborella trichopoda]
MIFLCEKDHSISLYPYAPNKGKHRCSLEELHQFEQRGEKVLEDIRNGWRGNPVPSKVAQDGGPEGLSKLERQTLDSRQSDEHHCCC